MLQSTWTQVPHLSSCPGGLTAACSGRSHPSQSARRARQTSLRAPRVASVFVAPLMRGVRPRFAMFYLALFGPYIAAALSCVVFFAGPKRARFLVTVSLTAVALCWSVVPAWLLRDGMGPGSEVSQGLYALAGFLEGMVLPTLLALAIVVPAAIRYRSIRRREDGRVVA